jgi:hypothetical protein
MGLIISLIASGSFIMTAFGIFGEGTCSFSGRGGARVLMVTVYNDGSGAVSCNLAAILMLIAVASYWIYIFSQSGYSSNYSYEKTPSFNSDLYPNPISKKDQTSPVGKFLSVENGLNEKDEYLKTEEEKWRDENPKVKEEVNKETDIDTDIEALEAELEEMKKKKIEAEKKRKEDEAKKAAELKNLTDELEKLKEEIRDIEKS